MSAICGILNFDNRQVNQSEIEAMVESSPGRGPDGTTYRVSENTGFAHLAFNFSPESVHETQPLVSKDGRFALVSDARLDNREELAGKLDLDPEHLKSLGDPELLLLAWQAWGASCAEKLLGDFVFAVWDEIEQRLFLARDPLGGHGLAYRHDGNTFVFASEVSAILDLPEVDPKINQDAVLRNLAGLQLTQQETFFESVYQLPPAHCLLVSASGSRMWKYWEIDPGYRISYRDEREYTDHFLDLLTQAVAARLRAQGPFGISLSGGADSTLLAALAQQNLSGKAEQGNLRSFSYVFDRFTECDERKYIEPVVQQYGIDARYLPADHLWSFARLRDQEIPRDFFWVNCFSQLPVSIAHAAGDAGCRVLIDGMFGDALFCEPSLFAADLLRRGRLVTLLQLLRATPEPAGWKRELFRYGIWPLLPTPLRQLYRRLRNSSTKQSFPGLTKAQQVRLEELKNAIPAAEVVIDLSPGRATRYKRIFQPSWAHGFAATRSRPYNQHGLECVSPYFDRRLIEFVMAMPTEMVSNSARSRKLQFDAMRRLLPEVNYKRTEKTSFEPLLRAGFSEEGEVLASLLGGDSLAVQQGWAEENWLAGQVSALPKEPDSPFALSQWVHLELWLRAIDEAQIPHDWPRFL